VARTSGSYRFAVTPLWLVFHIAAIAGIVAFVSLGFWQLRRLDERNVLDERIAERMAAPADDLSALLASGGPDAIELRNAIARGRYEIADEVVLQSQSLDGVSGHHVLTPLSMDDGSAVIVDRGWVPIDLDVPPVAGAEPPDAPVAVEGVVRVTQTREGLGPIDPPTGRLERVSRVDVERIQAQVDYPLVPVWLQLTSQDPGQRSPLPRPIPPATPGGGPPHLAYAVQWFVFAGVALVGYPLVLRRRAGEAP
jgi:surfeit locus 1 family protein